MSLWTCAGCSTRYAPGSPACPHCRSTVRAGEGSVRPWLDVACGTPGCAAYAKVVRVHLRQCAPGVVEMPGVLVCVPCGAGMGAVGSWEDGHVAVLGVLDAVPAEAEPVSALPRHGGDGGDDGAEDQ
jgi:hypothetical protein